MKRFGMCLTVLAGLYLAGMGTGWALTIDEAIELAKKNLPSYRAAEESMISKEALYKATLGAYLPSLDADASREIHDTSSRYYDTNTYGIALSYKLFDGGKRRADRDTAGLNLASAREGLRKNLQELVLNVKIAYYTAAAVEEIVIQRRSQLEYAGKDYEVAEGRNRLGVSRLSDVLQASVRVEQARYNLIQAEGNYRKAISELFSLIGRPSEDPPVKLSNGLEDTASLPSRDALRDAVLRRPEILQTQYALDRAKLSKDAVTSEFYPTLSASLGYNRTSEGSSGNPGQDRTAMLSASWNLFELGKFYRRKSSETEIRVSEESLREMKRQLSLDLEKNYEDFVTAGRNVGVAAEQVRRAEQNYDQAFGEYKVGKGDILSLVQAETLLATAREQATAARLSRILAEVQVERTAGTAAPSAAEDGRKNDKK